MIKRISLSLILASTLFTYSVPVKAQWDLNGTTPNVMNSAGVGSPVGNVSQPNPILSNDLPTQYNHLVGNQSGYLNNIWGQNQNIAAQAVGQQLAATQMSRLSLMQNGALPTSLPGIINGLPPTSLDSFVRNAGGHAEAIYGDEGTNSWPPLNGLSPANTINAGIVGVRSKTITTGHGGDVLPDASGLGSSRAP